MKITIIARNKSTRILEEKCIEKPSVLFCHPETTTEFCYLTANGGFLTIVPTQGSLEIYATPEGN